MSSIFNRISVEALLKLAMTAILFAWLIVRFSQGLIYSDINTTWAIFICFLSAVIQGWHIYILTAAKGRGETSLIVDRGLYTMVRHPRRLADALLLMGLGLLVATWSAPVLVAIGLWAVIAQSKSKDEELAKKFGQDFINWREQTYLVFPRIY